MGNADHAVIDERSKVFNYFERHDHLFVSGSAGTGKTSLLRDLSDSFAKLYPQASTPKKDAFSAHLRA